jgi:hypothetical protein
MKDAYRKAKAVNVWLGLSNEHASVGVEILSFLTSAVDLFDNPPWTRLPPEMVRAGCSDIMQRHYFRRLWVVQEVAVAQHLIISVDRQSFDWSSKNTIRCLNRLKFVEISPQWEQAGLKAVDMTPLIEIVEIAAMRQRGMRPIVSSLDVIYSIRHRTTSEPRDMIYGLFSLASHEPTFKVDSSLSKEVLFRKFYEHIKSIYYEDPQELNPRSSAETAFIEPSRDAESHLREVDVPQPIISTDSLFNAFFNENSFVD